MPTPVSTQCIYEEVAVCNKEVEAVVVRQQKTKLYHSYSSKQRADIGRYAAQHGPTAASRQFTKELGHPVTESTARKFRDLYCKELESSRKRHTEYPGRELLGAFDSEYMRMLRISADVVNT